MNTPLIKVETEIDPIFLCYDWKISRKSRVLTQPVTERHRYEEKSLLSVTNQPLTADKTTQSHRLNLIFGDTAETLYISEIRLYLAKQANSNYAVTFSGIYTLAEIQQGKIHCEDDTVPMFKTTSGKTTQAENYTVSCQISREKRAFFCTSILSEEEYYQGKCRGDDPFAKAAIKYQLQERMSYPYPHQRDTSLCGPAAFYYCLLKDRPDLYEQVAWKLWKLGKAKLGELIIKPGYDCRHLKQTGRISSLDWLTLASLRDSSNVFRDYDEVSDEVSGITLPSGLVSWFAKIGSKNMSDSTNLFFSRKLAELVQLNQYYGKNLHIVLFIAHKVIRGTDGVNTKDHWIVLADKIKVNGQDLTLNSPMDGIITARFFTWGNFEELPSSMTLNTFLNHFYGGLVFKPIK